MRSEQGVVGLSLLSPEGKPMVSGSQRGPKGSKTILQPVLARDLLVCLDV